MKPRVYWKGIEERQRTPEFLKTLEGEFAEEAPEPGAAGEGAQSGELARRSFLKAAGFSFAGTMLAACSGGPAEKAIPLLTGTPEQTPGRSSWYATTCAGCGAGCGILAKSRDGRPIKIEGNPDHPLSAGGICAVGQATVLGLYDAQRLRKPSIAGQTVEWSALDAAVRSQLGSISEQVYLLTGTVTSPTTRAIIASFLGRFKNSAHVEYDPVSYSAILDAHERTFGARVLPHYRFERAELIVSFDADFLGTWISPVEFTKAYTRGRSLEGGSYARHIQVEGRLSLTGSNADRRIRATPDGCRAALREIADRLARMDGSPASSEDAASARPGAGGASGGVVPTGVIGTDVDAEVIAGIAAELWNLRGRSLVVCGLNDVASQRLVNIINQRLGNYGRTLEVERPSRQWNGSDAAVGDLMTRMQAGEVKALLIEGVNPVYSLPDGRAFAEALGKIPLSVCFTDQRDETAESCRYVCPTHHFLESWNDAELLPGVISVSQPLIRPLGDTRSLREALAAWMETRERDLDLLQYHWREKLFPRQSAESSFTGFWDHAVQDGHTQVLAEPVSTGRFQFDPENLGHGPEELRRGSEDLRHGANPLLPRSLGSDPEDLRHGPETSARNVRPDSEDFRPFSEAQRAPAPAAGASFALVLYQKVGMLDGRHAHNPWLHELPDPVTKAVWDNYVSLAPATARALGVVEGQIVEVATGAARLELPAQIQPGQHERVIAVALGYGRKGTDRFARIGPQWLQGHATVKQGETIGKNAFLLADWRAGTIRFETTAVVKPTERKAPLAFTQTHHTIAVPDHLGGGSRDMVRETTLAAYRKDPASGNGRERELLQLWEDDHAYTGHRWGLAIDLNRCTGCSACVIACQAENNVPVVGKDEVSRSREMAWIRIDRYYSGDDADLEVLHQPVMCQHCEHAPCETVCPVLATVHSSEGLNQQVYNRCIGTRYCANNCPYKVRRFNWFDYRREDELEHLVLNPDVTTRTRGVMEKCSMCVQRVQDAKAEAGHRGVALADGDIQVACAQSCPGDAIVFGDMNDPASRLSRRSADPRHYRLLEELGVKPSVGYLTKIRNRKEDERLG